MRGIAESLIVVLLVRGYRIAQLHSPKIFRVVALAPLESGSRSGTGFDPTGSGNATCGVRPGLRQVVAAGRFIPWWGGFATAWGNSMGPATKGFLSLIGSVCTWLAGRLYGDEIFVVLRAVTPSRISDATLEVLTFCPPIFLLLVGVDFFLKASESTRRWGQAPVPGRVCASN